MIKKIAYVVFFLTMLGCSDAKEKKFYSLLNKVLERPGLEAKPIKNFFQNKNAFEVDNFKEMFNSQLLSNSFFNKKLFTKKSILGKFKISEIYLVGIIEIFGKKIGLIKVKNSEIFPIYIGDNIGVNKGKIVEINDNFLQIEENIFVEGVHGMKKIKMDLLYNVRSSG